MTFFLHMELKYLNKGYRPSLKEVLDRREKRDDLIRKLDKTYEGSPIILLTLNIPGPVKNNPKIYQVFYHAKEEIKEKLKDLGIKVLYEKEYSLPTGPELYLVVDGDGYHIKSEMTQIEDKGLGRLYDIDLLLAGKFISRSDLKLEERKCFLCEKPAKLCGRSRAHDLEAMLVFIENLIDEYL